MNILEIFKYNSLISIPLFSVITLFLIKGTPCFSFSKHTVSKSIFFLTHPIKNWIFRFNFVVKALLDLSFDLYVLHHLHISYTAPVAFILCVSALFFGLLAYFTEGKYTVLHVIFIYSHIVLWTIGHILIAYVVGNGAFLLFTIIFLSSSVILGFWSLFTSKTNVLVQAVCMSILYTWLLIFVFQYL